MGFEPKFFRSLRLLLFLVLHFIMFVSFGFVFHYIEIYVLQNFDLSIHVEINQYEKHMCARGIGSLIFVSYLAIRFGPANSGQTTNYFSQMPSFALV